MEYTHHYQTQANIVLNYFSAFSDKDISRVSRDFAENITLKDWEIYRSGKEDVVDVIKEEIFDKVESIHIFPVSMHFSHEPMQNTTVTCKIDILINGSKRLEVVDMIVLSKDIDGWKITRIDAYKR